LAWTAAGRHSHNQRVESKAIDLGFLSQAQLRNILLSAPLLSPFHVFGVDSALGFLLVFPCNSGH